VKKIETKSTQFQNVLAKAIEKKPLVKIGQRENEYLVRSSAGDFYPVRFERGAGGAMLGSCSCAGAERGFHCYHLAAALLAHSAFVRAGLRSPATARRGNAPILPEIAEALRVPAHTI